MDQDTFRNTVKMFVELHDELNASAKHMRELRRKREQLSEAILEFMQSHDVDECALQDGKLMRKQSKRTGPLNKEHILKQLNLMFESEKAVKAVENIFSKRELIEKPCLLRTRKRVVE